jgi:YD repeat-containing protein
LKHRSHPQRLPFRVLCFDWLLHGSFDQDGRIASYTLPNQSFALGYDAASRIGFISDIANPANTTNLGYDSLDRLTSFAAPSTTQSFAYDPVGNRTAQTIGTNTNTYSYGAASNRLASLTPTTGPVRNFSFDANGSTTNDALNQYSYDARGRLTKAISVAGQAQYGINALGQRVIKTTTAGTTVFTYDSSGRLIAETDAQGNVSREYVYLNDIPVAVFQ